MENKIFLIHWNEDEAQEHVRQLQDAGWQVAWESKDGAHAVNAIKNETPQAIVIYLTRLPSHGRETADYLQSLKNTRHIPIVFVDGQGEALEKTKAKVPEAIYTSSGELQSVLIDLVKDY